MEMGNDLRNLLNGIVISIKFRRVEQPDYPERSVIEGIVNAIIHRNYLDV